jgi:hypothetical protein
MTVIPIIALGEQDVKPRVISHLTRGRFAVISYPGTVGVGNYNNRPIVSIKCSFYLEVLLNRGRKS